MRVITERGETERRRAAPSRDCKQNHFFSVNSTSSRSPEMRLVASDFITTERALSFTSIENASFVCIAVYVCIWRLTPARAGKGPRTFLRIPAAALDAAATAAAEARAGTPTDRTPAAASAAAEAPAAAAAEENQAGTPTDRTPARRERAAAAPAAAANSGWRLHARLRRHLSVIRHRLVPEVISESPRTPRVSRKSSEECVRDPAPRRGHPASGTPRAVLTCRCHPRVHTIPPPAFASDSFFLDPPGVMPSGFACPLWTSRRRTHRD